MSASDGKRLLHYVLVEKIGVGGMGEVWRATDTTLGRDVAIKMLPQALATDPERLARFDREARVLASMNHPHIAGIHGMHAADGVRFLAMELVAGQELAQRIAAGAIPVEEAIPIAIQIATALEYAHERGIVHRDLKPANVKITPGDDVKVLDFGLAKALTGDGDDPVASAGMPTITSAGTRMGTILGTAAYMSPEQARGRPVDRRTDIWAFGCVVYEMITGRRAFEGETASDTLAAVLRQDVDWSALPASTPAELRRLLRRCLASEPRARLHDIADARLVLEEMRDGRDEPALAVARGAPNRRIAFWVAGAFALGGLAGAGIGMLRQSTRAIGEAVDAGNNMREILSLSIPDGTYRILASRTSLGLARACFLPDNRRFLYTHDEKLMVQDSESGNAHEILAAPAGHHYVDVSLSNNGRWIAFLEVWDESDIWMAEFAPAKPTP